MSRSLPGFSIDYRLLCLELFVILNWNGGRFKIKAGVSLWVLPGFPWATPKLLILFRIESVPDPSPL